MGLVQALLPGQRVHSTTLLCECFFFNDTATTEIYTLSLHDALPISSVFAKGAGSCETGNFHAPAALWRSEEHTSELQSQSNLVCRLLLEKKKTVPYFTFLSSPQCSYWFMRSLMSASLPFSYVPRSSR